MSRRVQENLIAGALLCVFLAAAAMSLDYGPRARMIPLPIAILGAVLMFVQIVWQNLRSTEELQLDLLETLTRKADKVAAEERKEEAPRGSAWRKELAALGIVATLAALILLVGPVPAVFLFTGAYFLLSRHYSWSRGLIYTAGFTAAIYLLFVVALQIQLYHGILAPLVERFR
jgi:hypothetical protein